MRTMIIGGVIIVIVCVSMFFYLEYDRKKFEASLPKQPIQNVTKESSVPNPQNNLTDSLSTPGISHETDTKETAGPRDNTEYSAVLDPNERIPEKTYPVSEVEEKTTGIVDEYSVAEMQAIFKQAFDFPVADIDETYTQLSEILTARFGSDSEISSFLSTWKALNTVMALADAAEYQGGREEDVNAFLNQLPAIIMEDMVEISIRLFNPSESEAQHIRSQVADFRMEIDKIAIAMEAKPWVEEAVRLGDLTAEEGADFLREVSGLDVDIVPK